MKAPETTPKHLQTTSVTNSECGTYAPRPKGERGPAEVLREPLAGLAHQPGKPHSKARFPTDPPAV